MPSGSGEDFLISAIYFRYFLIIYYLKRAWSFIWTNLNPLNSRMLCAKFGWNWPSGSGEEDENVTSLQMDGRTTSNQKSSLGQVVLNKKIFKNFINVFHYFLIIPPWKRVWPFIWKIESLYRRMLCVKFGWNRPSCSWGEDFF